MISPLLKNELGHLSEQLIRFHKELLDHETRLVQKQDGRRYGPYELLDLCLRDPRFQWLRGLSQFITGIDMSLSCDQDGTEPLDLKKMLCQLHDLLNDPENEFCAGYRKALEEAPQLVIQEVEVKKAASTLTPFLG